MSIVIDTSRRTSHPAGTEPVAGCIRGDDQAWRTVFDRHADTIRGYARARLGPDLCDDVLTETFATAWAERARIRSDVTTLLPWLLGIATNHVQRRHALEQRWTDGLRRASRYVDADARADDPADLAWSDTPSMRALAALPPGEREILLLVALGELRVTEAASAAGISAVAARVRLSRARRRAAAFLAQHDRSEVTT